MHACLRMIIHDHHGIFLTRIDQNYNWQTLDQNYYAWPSLQTNRYVRYRLQCRFDAQVMHVRGRELWWEESIVRDGSELQLFNAWIRISRVLTYYFSCASAPSLIQVLRFGKVVLKYSCLQFVPARSRVINKLTGSEILWKRLGRILIRS